MTCVRKTAVSIGLFLGAVASGCTHESNLPPPLPAPAPLPSPSPSAARALPGTALGLYTLACEKGSADGCNSAGVFLEDGRDGATPDPTRADALFQHACDLGSPAGCGNLGARLRKRDEVRAIGLLTRSCDASWWAACFVLGDIYESGDRQDWGLAAAVFERACKAKHQPSCAALGSLYLRGNGVARDASKAWSLFETACEADVDFACTLWANLMIKGQGGTQYDLERARTVFEKGCKDTFPAGCYSYALACANGLFGDGYTAQSVPLMRRACEHGYGDACAVLAKWLDKE